MIRTLTIRDLPAAMRLKEAAGWNQTRQDWELVMRMAPDGCFGLECEGELAATTTAVRYGTELAWIGMVLTHPRFRGRGFARRLMEHAIAYLELEGVAWMKLDATDMGYPLYRKLGFEDECVVERWMRGPGAEACGTAESCGAPCHFALEEWIDLDREAFGADRSRLLAELASGEAAAVPGGGYAMGRAGSKAAYFGPSVTQSAEAARVLLCWFLRLHPQEPVYWDLFPDNAAAVELARELGFECRRKLVRMARRGAGAAAGLTHKDALNRALAGFEYG